MGKISFVLTDNKTIILYWRSKTKIFGLNHLTLSEDLACWELLCLLSLWSVKGQQPGDTSLKSPLEEWLVGFTDSSYQTGPKLNPHQDHFARVRDWKRHTEPYQVFFLVSLHSYLSLNKQIIRSLILIRAICAGERLKRDRAVSSLNCGSLHSYLNLNKHSYCTLLCNIL